MVIDENKEKALEQLEKLQEDDPEAVSKVAAWVKANAGAGYRNLGRLLSERT